MENRLSVALREASRRPDYINLINTNFHECGLAPDGHVIARAAARYLGSNELRCYSPDAAGLPALRDAVVGYYRHAGITTTPERIVITASASESYSHIFNGICRRAGRVLLPRPGYPLFEDVARRSGLEPDFYDLHPDRGWRPDLREIAALAESGAGDVEAIVVISPNNPTGVILDSDEIRGIGEICGAHNAALIVDEVFSEFRFSGGDGLPRPIRLCPEIVCFTINGVSKLVASPDLKVSWIVVSGPTGAAAEAHEALEIENDLYLSSSPVNQYVAASLLDEGDAFTRRVVRTVAARRAAALHALERVDATCPGRVEWVAPEGGIHLPLLVNDSPRGLDDEELAIELLREWSVAVHPGYLYGVEDPTVLVMSYLSPEPVLTEGIRRIGEALARTK